MAAAKPNPSPRKRERPTPEEFAGRVTRSLVAQGRRVAREVGADALLIGLDAFREVQRAAVIAEEGDTKVFYTCRDPDAWKEFELSRARIVRLPNVRLGRTGQVRMGIVLGLARGMLKKEQVLVALSGDAGSDCLDRLIVLRLSDRYEAFLPRGREGEPEVVAPAVLERVISLAVELASEGREGKPVGAIFVVGDGERVKALSRQLILNPFQGYPPEQRNVLDPALEETVKELSALDGAFVIHGDGVIESAATYLKGGEADDVEVPKGLGARHVAAATITSLTNAVAITISMSTGTVSIFHRGRLVTEIDRLETLAAR